MNVIEFAAKRAARLVAADDEMRSLVKAALEPGGTWKDVIDGASVLWLETFSVEAPRADETKTLAAFQKTLIESLAKTETPTNPPDPAQVERVTTWLGTFTVNNATFAGLRSRGERQMRWVTMHDSAVRETHAAADGQVASSNETFDIGGFKLHYPGEPVGPPEIWINCRCLVAGGRIEPMAKPVTAAVSDPYPNEEEGDGIHVDEGEDTQPIETQDEDEALVDDPIEVPFHGVLAPEGVTSGDGRKFAVGALSTRDLPIPLMYQDATSDGHGGSVRLGRIDEAWMDNGLMKYRGVFRDTPLAAEVIEGIAGGFIRGVSVDIDDAEIEASEGDDGLEQLMNGGELVFSRARAAAATVVAIPAFQEAYIALGPDFEEDYTDEQNAALAACGCAMGEYADTDEFRDFPAADRKESADKGHALPDGSFPIENVDDLKNAIQAIGRAKDPDAAKAHIKKRAGELGHPELVPEDWAAETIVASAVEFAPGTHDGPGWLTDPKDTARLRHYWTKGEGAAKIRWGEGGDFNRCRKQLAKYVRNPEWLAGTCANMHKEALGIWPSTHGKVLKHDADIAPAQAVVLVASGFGYDEDLPPAEWFRDPGLTKPTPITVTADGRVYGHLAQWGVCHIGLRGVCTTAPHSASNYAYFNLGAVMTTEGDMSVGHLTVGTGHASLKWNAATAAAHYDNTGTVVADVHAGEDSHGIWVAGYLRPGATKEQVAALKASPISGDWRDVNGRGQLELMAGLAVNLPGFAVPRLALAASGGVQTALVAAGIVMETEAIVASVMPKDALELAGIARAAAREVLAEQKREQRLASLAPVKENLKHRRLEAARARIGER